MTSWPLIRRYHAERLQRWLRQARPWTGSDAAVRAALAAAGDDANAMSRALLRYFWDAQLHYIDKHGTLADYPGWPSCYGARNDAVEGVTRLMPLWAQALQTDLVDAEQAVAMRDGLVRALSHGCDPDHPGYWGALGARSTLICEAADVALAVWLLRDSLWPQLPAATRDQVLGWLATAIGQPTADNNWHLFAVLIDAVCTALNPAHAWRSRARLERVAQFRRADGCFSDGPDGPVDLYNAWGFHYLLYWLRQIAPQLDEVGSAQSLRDYVRWYRWLITDRGLPLWGRSLCYRFACPLPLQMAALEGAADAGEAVAAYVRTWRFFTAHGGLRAGRPTQGVFGEDQRWLDPYSGPASSFWGLRSLLLHLAGVSKQAWSPPSALPSSGSPGVNIRVEGLGACLRAGQGRSELRFDGPEGAALPLPWRWRERLRGWVYSVATRPANNLLRLGRRRFDSQLEYYR